MMLHSYPQFNEIKRELAQTISDIALELERLNLLISHAGVFVPPSDLSVEEYKLNVLEKIEKLSLAINEFNDQSITEEVGEHLAQFNLHCIELSQMLKSMIALPEIGEAGEVYDDCETNFDRFAEELPQDPNRVQLLNAFNEASKLLENVDTGLTLINEHPALMIAETLTEGALVLAELNPDFTLRP